MKAVLVLRARGLGEFLTAVPALRAIAEAFPDHRRVLAAPAGLEPLARLTGAVDVVCHTPSLAPLDPSLARPELAIDLHGCGPRSHRLLLATSPGRLLAFAHPDVLPSAGFPEWDPEEHEVRRWCRLLDECGIPADPDRLDLDPAGLPSGRVAPGATIVHPGAPTRSRRWPAERWAAVAASERASGHRVVVTGTRGDRTLAETVARLAGLDGRDVLAGRVGLTSLCSLVADAGRVICGDTWIGHLATAFGTPSVGLFGPVPPERCGPPPGRAWHRVIWAGPAGEPHGGGVHPGLLAIDVSDVLAELSALESIHPVRETAAAG